MRIINRIALCSWLGWGLWLGWAMCMGVPCSVWAADPPKPNSPPASPERQNVKRDMSKAETISIIAKDGFPVHFVYWGSEVGRESPVIVHLHGKGGSYRDFPPAFIDQLHRAGYAQILVDLRGHGKSKGEDLSAQEKKDPTVQRLAAGKLKPSDYDDMVTLDLDAIKQFIYEEHQLQFLNMNRMAIVALDMSTPVAAAFAQVDWQKPPYEDAPDPAFQTPRGQDVRALVLVSPMAKIGNISITGPLEMLREPDVGMSFLLAFGGDDRLDNGATEKLFKLLNPGDKNKAHVEMVRVGQALRGSELLGKNLGVDARILVFLDQHVKVNGSEWRDRQSRLDKKRTK